MTFIKWCGGKNQLLLQLSDLFPPMKNITGYCEPFLGGGSVFFFIERQGYLLNKPVHLSDINSSLIATYKMVRDNLKELVELLTKYQENHTEKLYYEVRDNFHNRQNPLIIASEFIYLNKTCFNGMWTVNSKGVNNASIGHKEKVNIFDPIEIERCSRALKYANINTMSYEKVVDIAKKNYFAYIDPPYDNIKDGNSQSFSSYTPDNFKQKRHYLLDTFRKLDEIGCKVMMSNSSTPWMMTQFKDYYITVVKAKRICAGDAEKRIPVDEVIVTNYKPTKKQFSMEDY